LLEGHTENSRNKTSDATVVSFTTTVV